jgi:predicted RNA-binding protein with RPS1 domain
MHISNVISNYIKNILLDLKVLTDLHVKAIIYVYRITLPSLK